MNFSVVFWIAQVCFIKANLTEGNESSGGGDSWGRLANIPHPQNSTQLFLDRAFPTWPVNTPFEVVLTSTDFLAHHDETLVVTRSSASSTTLNILSPSTGLRYAHDGPLLVRSRKLKWFSTSKCFPFQCCLSGCLGRWKCAESDSDEESRRCQSGSRSFVSLNHSTLSWDLSPIRETNSKILRKKEEKTHVFF